jgi:protein ImuB
MTDAPSLFAGPGRRFLCLVLPHLPTDRIWRQRRGRSWRSAAPPEAPLAVAAKARNALRLSAVDETAERLGLACGMALADARAMIPALDVVEADEAADRALLAALADWAECATPLVAIASPQSLVLDITGCAHLFGGEAKLRDSLVARLAAQGFDTRAAVADTAGAAAAAANFGGPALIASGETAAALAPLPLAALRIEDGIVAALERVGLKRIGQIVGTPRAPLAARFGALLLRRLDQALGDEEEAISPRRPVPALMAERRFAEPILQMDDIAATLASLAGRLALSLEARGQGARAFELALFRVDGAVIRIAVGTSRPLRAPKLVLDLFREKFAQFGDGLDAGFGFDMMRLSVPATAPADAAQIDLSGEAEGRADLDQLVDRIGARLGPERIGRLTAAESHIPERALRFAAATDMEDDVPPSAGEALDRPLRLLERPEPVEATAAVPDGPPAHFRWRRAQYRVARAEGPERIAGEWWRESVPTRDYFRVEDAEGHRFWLYREGLYGRETATPRWFMHGIFA